MAAAESSSRTTRKESLAIPVNFVEEEPALKGSKVSC
jgi:hypothetical protein